MKLYMSVFYTGATIWKNRLDSLRPWIEPYFGCFADFQIVGNAGWMYLGKVQAWQNLFHWRFHTGCRPDMAEHVHRYSLMLTESCFLEALSWSWQSNIFQPQSLNPNQNLIPSHPRHNEVCNNLCLLQPLSFNNFRRDLGLSCRKGRDKIECWSAFWQTGNLMRCSWEYHRISNNAILPTIKSRIQYAKPNFLGKIVWA